VVNKDMILLVLEPQLIYPSPSTSCPDNMEMSWSYQNSHVASLDSSPRPERFQIRLFSSGRSSGGQCGP